MSYAVNGIFYNLNEQANEQVEDKHAPNKNINYICVNFKNISFLKDGFSNVKIGENDYILLDLKIPSEEWSKKYNLLNFTPYFYTYKNENVFASINETIQTNLKICCTCSNTIAKKFKLKGYTISSIPVEYITEGDYLILIRIGVINTNEYAEIPSTFKATYYKSNINTNYREVVSIKYSTQRQILEKLPSVIQPIVNMEHLELINEYVEIKNSFDGYINHKSYQFLSNIYNTTYPFKSFYDAITIEPYGNLQLNNTCENYFNSNYIISGIGKESDKYFYILSANQKRFGCGLTSSIELYNKNNNSSIYGIDTANILPSLNNKLYPYTFENTCESYTYYLLEISEKQLIEKDINIFYVVERIGYNPTNLNSSNYQYINSFEIYHGDKIDLNIFKQYDIYIGVDLF